MIFVRLYRFFKLAPRTIRGAIFRSQQAMICYAFFTESLHIGIAAAIMGAPAG